MGIQELYWRITQILRDSHYARSILKVVTGTSTAQFIAILSIPILSRIYPAESFGLLGIFIALSNIFRVLFTLRYDFALPNAKTNAEANSLLYLTLILSVSFSVIVGLILIVSGKGYFDKFGEVKYILPIMFLVTSIDGSITFFISRARKYGLLSISRVVRAALIGSAQIVYGFMGFVDSGLLYGILVGEGLSVLFISIMIRNSSFGNKAFSIKRVSYVAKKNIQNPIYLFPGHILNIGSAQLPMIVIENVYGSSVAGLLYMAIKLISLPGQLIGVGVFKVFTSEAAKLYNKSGECFKLTIRTLFSALALYIVIFLLIDVIAYMHIGTILGAPWVAAVPTILIYSAIELIPAVFFTISGIWTVTNNQKLNLKYQVLRALFVVSGLSIGVVSGDYYMTLIIYGLFRSVSYLTFMIKCVSLSRGVMQGLRF